MQRIWRSVRYAALLYMLILVAFPVHVWAAQSPTIDSIKAEVISDSLPKPVKGRMEKSILAISEQLLEGKPLEAVVAEKAEYEEIIRQVFDKVLVGYTVTDVVILPETEAMVQVSLVSWHDTIQTVQADVAVEGMSAEVERLLRQDTAGMEQIFRQSLENLPLAAIDWTHGLLKKQLNDFLQEHAPEFRADFDIQAAREAKVRLVLYPRLPVVRNMDLSMRSDTMLNAGLLMKREKLQAAANQLIGVPVGFTVRHKRELEYYLADTLNQDEEFRQLDMQTVVSIMPGEQLRVMSRSNSGTYRVRLEGWADMGNTWGNQEDASLRARLHLGRMLSSRDELFVQSDFYPQRVRWSFDTGYRYTLPSGTSLGVMYTMPDNGLKLELWQPLSSKWLLRYEYQDSGHHSEYGIRYKLHDFLSLEYAIDANNSWLRFIGYF